MREMTSHHKKSTEHNELHEDLYAVKCYIKEEIKEHVEDGIESWDDLEKLHLLLDTKRLIWKYLEHSKHDSYEKYGYVYDMVDKTLCECMPETWYKYLHHPGGHMSIIEMELEEMDKAYKGMKAATPTVSHAEFIRSLKHMAAAIIFAIEAMTCKCKAS